MAKKIIGKSSQSKPKPANKQKISKKQSKSKAKSGKVLIGKLDAGLSMEDINEALSVTKKPIASNVLDSKTIKNDVKKDQEKKVLREAVEDDLKKQLELIGDFNI